MCIFSKFLLCGYFSGCLHVFAKKKVVSNFYFLINSNGLKGKNLHAIIEWKFTKLFA